MNVNKVSPYNESLARGLSALMGSEHKSERPLSFEDCAEFTSSRIFHPFSLSLPATRLRRTIFVGAGYGQREDLSVPVFLANIRFYVGPFGRREVVGLRIISIPFTDNVPEHHYFFFEIQLKETIIISGETNDCQEEPSANKSKLEDVFVLLSDVYSVNIERVSAQKISLAELYEEKERHPH